MSPLQHSDGQVAVTLRRASSYRNRRVTCSCGVALVCCALSFVGCAGRGADVDAVTTLSQHLAAGGRSTGAATDADAPPVTRTVARDRAASGGSYAGSAIAHVNGRPIDARSFVKTLVEARGLQLLQQMVLLEAVRAEAERRNVSVEPADIDHEYDLTLKDVAGGNGNASPLSSAQREALIDEWTRRNSVPRDELAIAMARQALLRKLAEAEVRVTSEDVRAELERTRGERVVVRHMQLPAPRTYARVKARLDRGDAFEDLVTDYSINLLSKAEGGLLPPFTRNDPTVPRAFANVAFELKPGEVSPLFESEGGYHVIKLERVMAAKDGSLGESRRDMERSILERRIAERMQALGREILENAKIRIDEATLRGQYKDRRRRGLIEGPPLAN